MGGRREGGRGAEGGAASEKGLAVRREKEGAVKLEKDVSAGPDYRGPRSSQTFYHPRHQNQRGDMAGERVAAGCSPGPGPRPQAAPLPWQAGAPGSLKPGPDPAPGALGVTAVTVHRLKTPFLPPKSLWYLLLNIHFLLFYVRVRLAYVLCHLKDTEK